MTPRRQIKEPNLAPTVTVRQHTVPRMYLAHFAIDDRVPVYDLEEEREFVASTRDAAVRTGFYDLRVGGRKLSTEYWLSTVEAVAASIIGRLQTNPDALLSLPTEDEDALGRFICAQIFRVQAFRDTDASMRQQLLDHVRNAGRSHLERTTPPELVEEIWDEWMTKPDEWWLNEQEPYQPAATAASMLSRVQGFTNLLRAMPWRIGLAHAAVPVYTSDNPVSRYAPPASLQPGFAALANFMPLSSRVLLKIGPGFIPDASPQRLRKDFTSWETSFVRHLVTRDATRFLYGLGPYVPRECASTCLGRLDAAKMSDAARGLKGALSVNELGYAT
jgi:hypothetical protein